ncbi:MAG: VWA domain-containing protein [Planctomycetota bacterium]
MPKMSHTAEITRTNPTSILFMIDQSRSMSDVITGGDRGQQKAICVADSINHWLQELSLKCAKAGGVYDYYHIGVIGYGGKVGSALVGPMAGRDMVPISEIAENPGRVEKRKMMLPGPDGSLTKRKVKVPVWFEPVADGGTPMCAATAEAHRIMKDWLADHGSCYPPQIIHITDGEATDGNPGQRLRALTALSSSDGATLLFNIHISSNPDAVPIVFPDTADDLPDAYSHMLFETASLLTPNMRAVADQQGYPTTDRSRAFVLNADIVSLVQAIEIGTRAANVVMEAPSDSFPSDAAAAEIAEGRAALAAEKAAREGTRVAVTLSVLDSGELVDAQLHTDKKGRITKIVPAKPLDPRTEYRVGPELR